MCKEDKNDWYKVKPRKKVDVQLNLNKAVEFKKDDKPIVVSFKDSEAALLEEIKAQNEPEPEVKPMSFAR